VTTIPELPYGLRVLNMSNSERYSMEPDLTGAIPTTVTHMKLAEAHEQPIAVWPLELQVLELGGNYHRYIEHLPATLTELRVKNDRGNASMLFIEEQLPQGLKVLNLSNFGSKVEALPNTLEVLQLICIRIKYHNYRLD
jgi:hypothetical protein